MRASLDALTLEQQAEREQSDPSYTSIERHPLDGLDIACARWGPDPAQACEDHNENERHLAAMCGDEPQELLPEPTAADVLALHRQRRRYYLDAWGGRHEPPSRSRPVLGLRRANCGSRRRPRARRATARSSCSRGDPDLGGDPEPPAGPPEAVGEPA
jgi:hypothetical protein